MDRGTARELSQRVEADGVYSTWEIKPECQGNGAASASVQEPIPQGQLR